MKKTRIFILTAIFAVVAVAGMYAAQHYSSQYLASNNKGGPEACTGTHPTLRVTIKDGTVTPALTTGKLCDTLTITNKDNIDREIAFGPHEDHVPYDGVAERLLAQGQSLTVTLNQPGTFHFHDHIHDEVQGYFTVQR